MKPKDLKNRIVLVKGDITEYPADVIVNAANSSLLGGSGVDGAIHRKDGKEITEDCMKIRDSQGKCNVGEAVITRAGNMPFKNVIHTVGPVWQSGKNNEAKLFAEKLLKKAYIGSLHSSLSIKKLEDTIIPILSIEEQNKIAQRYFEKINEIKEIKKDLNGKIQITKEIFKKYNGGLA